MDFCLGSWVGQASNSFTEILKRMEGVNFTMEYKYDGERAQVSQSPKSPESSLDRPSRLCDSRP